MSYIFPSRELLNSDSDKRNYNKKELTLIGEKIINVMNMWRISARVIEIRITPVSVCFDVLIEQGSTAKNIKKVKEDISVQIGANIEIIEMTGDLPVFSVVVLPNERQIVNLRTLIDSKEYYDSDNALSVAMGITYDGKTVIADIEQMPHMLIAGTTGSGKTVFLDDIILSILYRCSPDDVKMFMVDPKKVDLSFYNGIPHLMSPVIYDSRTVFDIFGWAEDEMMHRYQVFAGCGVKNLHDYNDMNPAEKMPHILLIIDEYAELMKDYKKELEEGITRISGMGRAAGIHLIIATQRPTADVVTSSIKANMSCRVSFAVMDSKEFSTIIKSEGSHRLVGNGDMMFTLNSSSGTLHAQAPLVTEEEVKRVVEFIRRNS